MANEFETEEELAGEGMMDEGLVEEEPLEEEPMGEEELPETIEGTVTQFTVDELPELSDLTVGDQLTFEVSNISDDGVYDLAVRPMEALPEEAGPPPGMGAGPAGPGAIIPALTS